MNGAASFSGRLPDLLLVAPCLPYPSGTGHRLRWNQLLKFLGQRYRVHLGCFVDPHDRPYLGRIQALCYETCFVPRPPAAGRGPGLQLFTSSEAGAVRACRSAALADWVARLQRRHSLHAALACAAPMALYLAQLDGVPRLVDFVALESARRRRLAAGRRWPVSGMWRREAALLCQYELAVARDCDHLFFSSHSQAGLFRSIAPAAAPKVTAVLNGVDADYFSPHILHHSPYPRGCRALLLAMRLDDSAQADAAEWFAREVFVRLRAADPDLRLYAVGVPGEPRLRALARHEGVVVAGPVEDLRPFLAHAALAVAPLHVASAAPSQVLEVLAMQKVLVASPPALEGVRALPDLEVLVATEAADYVRRIQWALASPGALATAKAGRARAAFDHSWTASFAPLAARIDEATCPTVGAR